MAKSTTPVALTEKQAIALERKQARAAAKNGKADREALAAAKQAEEAAAAIAAVHMPTQEQLDAECAAAAAEEVANLAAEAAEAAEQAAEVVVIDGYTGPMLALRERAKLGLYTKAANGQLCCADDLATTLGSLPPEGVIQACMTALNLTHNPYLYSKSGTPLNIGQQSMNLRNKLRHALKSGIFGFGVVVEAVEEVTEALAEQAKINANRT